MTKAIKIKELSKYINSLVKRDPILANLHVEGEVSNFKISSGNVYFVLKDEAAALRCIIFKNMGLAKTISIKDGMKVIARGSLTTYDYGSYYQLLVKEIVSDGIGDIYQQFEILKNKLAKEGLFSLDHKVSIPSMPNSIGVITSPTGAAVRDIINTIRRRFPIANIYIYPSKVQGNDAPESLIKGLKFFDKSKLVDTIIIGRGGGSFEDLNSFNDETLLYEIHNTKTPVISAVGHEIDNMLSDYVADLRAATPTAAAELATPEINDLKNDLNKSINLLNKYFYNYFIEEKKVLDFYFKEINYYNPKERILNLKRELIYIKEKLEKNNLNYFTSEKNKINSIYLKIKNFNPINKIKKEREKLKVLNKLLTMNMNNLLSKEKFKIDSFKIKLDNFDSNKVLKYGYAKIYLNKKPIGSIEDVNIDDKVEICFHNGVAGALIENKENKFE
ncbi:exodeoxyribonuclease VII large subunit [Miniphocaeibacter halophilus]|uniref:Exodeoxyribonuclease VII large subunit n=1 Tax=Miniphocaeibacter halophilus TaxID=2931922 RepID=A0AC61MPN4_9FIRM|nr:exodeoxyribonuclease VII large subunit [Miniphocaeibacter halophilus]QQK07550.1 exodeoxyribonuclease VII large subunit [Miniphocaeibacter halophilus]